MAAGNTMQTPPFLTKLYQLVNDPHTSALVSWTDDKGLSFTVHKPSEFGRDILPRYFKHNNFSSFVRQLNQYGFHKQNPDKWMFGHDSFRKDRPDLLKNITRRRPKQANPTSTAVLPHPLAQNSIIELGNYGIEGEVKALKRDKDVLIQELVVTRRNEEQLRSKCTSLEGRISNLENTSKQMQAFIMHYFSQVLQPYSQAMASRKRKRLPPASPSLDNMDVIVEPPENTVAKVSHSPSNPSVDALRMMMQQMGVGMPTSPPAQRNPNPSTAIVERSTDGRSFAPATIQELPQDDQTNGKLHAAHPNMSVPRIGPPLPNGNSIGSSGETERRNLAPKRKSRQVTGPSVPPAGQQTPQLQNQAPPSPTFANLSPLFGGKSLISSPRNSKFADPLNLKTVSNYVGAHSNDNPVGAECVQTDSPLDFLSALPPSLPPSPNSSMTLDLIEATLDESKDLGGSEAKMFEASTETGTEEDSLQSTDFDVTFNAPTSTHNENDPCPISADDESALNTFLDLSQEDQPLPPPLSHLPEGTDIHALAQRIESFGHQQGE